MHGYLHLLIAVSEPAAAETHTHKTYRRRPLFDHLLYTGMLPDLISQYRHLTRHFGRRFRHPLRLNSHPATWLLARSSDRDDRIRLETHIYMQQVPQLRTHDEGRYDKQQRD